MDERYWEEEVNPNHLPKFEVSPRLYSAMEILFGFLTKEYEELEEISSCPICGGDFCDKCSVRVDMLFIPSVKAKLKNRYPDIKYICVDCYRCFLKHEQDLFKRVLGERGSDV